MTSFFIATDLCLYVRPKVLHEEDMDEISASKHNKSLNIGPPKSYVISDLKICSEYEIQIRVLGSRFYGPWTEPIKVKTPVASKNICICMWCIFSSSKYRAVTSLFAREGRVWYGLGSLPKPACISRVTGCSSRILWGSFLPLQQSKPVWPWITCPMVHCRDPGQQGRFGGGHLTLENFTFW